MMDKLINAVLIGLIVLFTALGLYVQFQLHQPVEFEPVDDMSYADDHVEGLKILLDQ